MFQTCIKDTFNGDLDFELEVVLLDSPSKELASKFLDALAASELRVCATLALFNGDIESISLDAVKEIIAMVKEARRQAPRHYVALAEVLLPPAAKPFSDKIKAINVLIKTYNNSYSYNDYSLSLIGTRRRVVESFSPS